MELATMIEAPFNYNSRTTIAILLTIIFAGTIMGQDGKESAYDSIWNRVVLYDDPDHNVFQKFAFTGRLQGDYYNFDDSESDFNWRRFRVGFKASLFNGLTLHSEADMNLNDPEPLYKKLTDTNLAWTSPSGMIVKLGRQSAPFTLDGSTSSKKLYTLERSKVSGNLGFPKEYFPGITFSGKRDNWEYLAGLFSSDHGPEFDEAFDYGRFGLFSVGYNFKENLKMDNALIRFDYLNQEQDSTNKTPHHKNVASLVTKFEGGNFHLWTDLSVSDGYGSQNDLIGLQLMPFYDITDKTQVVFRYTYLKSSSGDSIRLSKYEKDLFGMKGNEASEIFLGINHFFYGHKLKWQNGIQYTKMDRASSSEGYDGWGFTSGFRISW
ncbi:MAG: porin [Verrucomicrobiota bacterium]|nr:porin [Verrucomicrobiota bacterium]